MLKILKSRGLTYEIVSTLKESKGASVYKALRKHKSFPLSQEVILKTFSSVSACAEEFESLKQAKSPYCRKLLGLEILSKKLCLVLEFIKGVSLFKLLECFCLDEKEIQNLLIQIFKGLKDLESAHLCHGDLSLHNIILDEKAQIKLIDFGKANYKNELQGTLPFVAPEVLKGVKPNLKSDLFSLGVIEFFLKNTKNIHSLKEESSSFFVTKSILNHLDPTERKFLFEKENLTPLRSLEEKVNYLLKRDQAKEWQTEKLKVKEPFYFLIKKSLFFLVFLLSSFITVSSEKQSVGVGVLSIRTHKWVYLQNKEFKSYSPKEVLLPSGPYTLSWKSEIRSGIKKVHIPKGRTLILNDKDFFED